MNTYTTHTAREMARPSRLRVIRARVIAWHDEHRNALALVLVAVTALALASLSTLALIGDGAPVGYAWKGALGSLTVAFIVGMLAYLIGNDVGTENAHDNASHMTRVITRDMGDEIARLTRENNEQRATIARYASALVDMALDDDDK